jgi:hypothetical protein
MKAQRKRTKLLRANAPTSPAKPCRLCGKPAELTARQIANSDFICRNCRRLRTKDIKPGQLSDPNSASGKLQRIALDLLREHQRDDALPTSGRFLFYELEQRGILSKHGVDGNPANKLTAALMHLRRAGLVAWECIIDETRSLNDYTGYPTILAGTLEQLETTRLDPWAGNPPLLIAESRSLAGVLDNLSREYAVRIVATNGQVGGFLHTDVAPVLEPGEDDSGFPIGRRVLYLGDYDFQGGQIENNTREELEGIVGKLDWRRIALTEEQVRKYRLRRLQIMKPDYRFRPVRQHPAIETEALKQTVIVDIVRKELDTLLPEPLQSVLAQEEKQREPIAKALAELETELSE